MAWITRSILNLRPDTSMKLDLSVMMVGCALLKLASKCLELFGGIDVVKFFCMCRGKNDLPEGELIGESLHRSSGGIEIRSDGIERRDRNTQGK